MSQSDQNLEFVSSLITVYRNNKAWADQAIVQVSDKKLHQPLDSNTNSIVVVMKHVAGNLLSRWTDFLTTDGEKPWRNRDDEFVDSFTRRDEVLGYWEKGWDCLFATLEGLQPDDLAKTVTIRGEAHSIPLAMHRSLAHTAYHCGQIIMSARILAGDEWNTITVPPGKSKEFNQEVWGEAGFSSGPSEGAGESL